MFKLLRRNSRRKQFMFYEIFNNSNNNKASNANLTFFIFQKQRQRKFTKICLLVRNIYCYLLTLKNDAKLYCKFELLNSKNNRNNNVLLNDEIHLKSSNINLT